MVRNKNAALSLVVVLLMVVAFTAMTVASVFAAEANDKVNEACNGVVQVRVVYYGGDDDGHDIQWGSGFLINEMTVMTCRHVVTVDDETIDLMRKDRLFGPLVKGKSDKQVRDKIKIRITVNRDSGRPAEIIQDSESKGGDYVALKLKDGLKGYAAVNVRNSENLERTESCYYLGFPGKMVLLKGIDRSTYTKDDVDITPIVVTKYDNNDENVKTVYGSSIPTEGYSGGPTLDNDGNVIGITVGSFEGSGISTSTEEFLKTLDTLGIEYNKTDAVTTEDSDTEAKDEEKTEPLPDPVPAPDPVEKKSSLPIIPIVAGVAAVVIILIIVIILVFRKSRRKPEPVKTYMNTAGSGSVPPITGASTAPVVPPYGGSVRPETDVLSPDPGTTVLNDSGMGTTVLNAGGRGVIIRDKTGERISISKDNFKIGHDRSKVDYCVRDNTAVSRHHATIIVRGGDVFLVDKGSTNGTFVNDVKSSPNVEVKIHNGDKITLGDEEFTYNSN